MNRSFLTRVLVVLGLLSGPSTLAQEQADGDRIQLNFPQEIEIQGLIDYVSQRLGVKLLYDEQVAGKRITVKAPTEIPASSLLDVLESALKMKGLVMVDADAEGWKRIVDATNLPNVAPAGEAAAAIAEFGRGTPVTQTFLLEHTDPQKVDELIRPFLTQPGANSIVVPESGMIVVSDYASNMLRIAEWISYVDRPRIEVVTEFVPLKNVDAASMATQITQILSARARAEGRQPTAPTVAVSQDARTNQLLLVGQKSDVESAKEIVQSLDVPLGLVTRTYTFEHISASRVDQLVNDLIDPLVAQRLYRSTVDEDENLLIVTTTEEIHRRIEAIQRTRDIPARQGQSPIRFYKVKNLPVTELLNTIRSIERQNLVTLDAVGEQYQATTDGRIRPILGADPMTGEPRGVPSGPNNPPPSPGQELPTPPSYRGPESQLPLEPQVTESIEAAGTLAPGFLLGRARVTADIHTNTLIVIAEPAVQRVYSELIERLDRRRPQVLIDAKFVVIDTSDDFSLGVEFSSGDRAGGRRLFGFSQFGLSQVDPVTGALQIIPGLGFNGTLVDPSVADAVVRALTNHRRSRVTSAPRVLVNDNAEGQLSSVAEVPFTSINASNTVATTSFAGFAEAGTTVTVTPRISDDQHLQLDFVITINTFTGTGGDGVPPPRQTDEVRSQVTIPDGHTVIVGGLNRTTKSWDFDSFPFIDKVPLLRYAGGLETRSATTSSMFVFLTPTILRDDKFEDLKYVSRRAAKEADIRPQYPVSEPIWLP